MPINIPLNYTERIYTPAAGANGGFAAPKAGAAPKVGAAPLAPKVGAADPVAPNEGVLPPRVNPAVDAGAAAEELDPNSDVAGEAGVCTCMFVYNCVYVTVFFLVFFGYTECIPYIYICIYVYVYIYIKIHTCTPFANRNHLLSLRSIDDCSSRNVRAIRNRRSLPTRPQKRQKDSKKTRKKRRFETAFFPDNQKSLLILDRSEGFTMTLHL
jgi:hypothetical protein